MEECQAVVTRVPAAIAVAMVLLPALLPSPLLWRCCRCCCCGVDSVGAPRRSGEKQFQQYPASPLSLRYPSSLWRYPASPLSLQARRGLVAVSYFTAAVSCLTLVIAVSFLAVAVSCLALVVVGLYRCLVAAPVYRCREVGLWREIIDCVKKNLQTSYRAPPFILFPSLCGITPCPLD